jgi:glycine betaine/choline ABC-type transport system substrate-binding protein
MMNPLDLKNIQSKGKGGIVMRYLRRTLLPFVLVLGLMAGEGIGVLAQTGDGATIRVGSLSFTESTILGEMISQLLEEDGYTVERKPDLGGTAEAHQALVSGEVDLYVEYTGGALVSILGLPVPTAGTPDAATPAVSIDDQVLITVAENYLDQFSLVWLDEFGFNDTYALAVTAETAARYDLVTVSDLAAHAG